MFTTNLLSSVFVFHFSGICPDLLKSMYSNMFTTNLLSSVCVFHFSGICPDLLKSMYSNMFTTNLLSSVCVFHFSGIFLSQLKSMFSNMFTTNPLSSLSVFHFSGDLPWPVEKHVLQYAVFCFCVSFFRDLPWPACTPIYAHTTNLLFSVSAFHFSGIWCPAPTSWKACAPNMLTPLTLRTPNMLTPLTCYFQFLHFIFQGFDAPPRPVEKHVLPICWHH